MAKGTRVLILRQFFDPEPTFKGLVFARELVRRGYQVEVITGFPNYPYGVVYPGYQIKIIQKDVVDGVNVTRVPIYPSRDSDAVKRALNYISFAVTSFIYGLFFAKKADLIYAYHPPLTVGVTAILLKIFRRIPIVYDIQDMWPDTLKASGMIRNDRALKFVGNICNFVYRLVDQIVVLSPGFKSALIARGVPRNKVNTIYNWCDESAIMISSSVRPQSFPSDGFRVLFAGNMGKAQSLAAVLEAANILMYDAPTARFVFLGEGLELEQLKETVKNKRLENVVFHPAVPMNQVGKYLGAADALLVHLRKDPLFSITIPSKTQAYMAARKPIIMAVDGDAADLVRKAQCGYVAQSENPTSIADAVKKLMQLSTDHRDDLAQRGQHFYIDNLSFCMGVNAFVDIFEKF